MSFFCQMDETRLIQRAATLAANRAAFHDLAKDENKAIGEEFKAMRLSRGISLRALASKLGVSHVMVRSWETGDSFWTEEIARRYIEKCR